MRKGVSRQSTNLEQHDWTLQQHYYTLQRLSVFFWTFVLAPLTALKSDSAAAATALHHDQSQVQA
jgi:hypothetical protein